MTVRVREGRRSPAGLAGRPGRGRAAAAVKGRGTLEPTTQRILDLQRDAGNAAVAQLIAETTTGHRTLRFGSTGDDVRELQSALNARSDVETALEVDGIFGPITAQAVRELQESNPPLVVDAIVGPRTWAVIDAGPGTTNDVALAKKVFQRGANAYRRGDFAHAYDFFVRAFELAPRPGILFSEGQALRRLGGRREEAIACYEAYLATGHEHRRAEAQAFIAELRGPAPTGVEAVDTAAAKAAFEKGAALYAAGDFAHAYDQLTISWELGHRAGLLFSRAQALRRLGGRDPEAIALYQQYLATGQGTRQADAVQYIADLKGPARTGIDEIDIPAAKAAFEKGAALYAAGDFAHAYDEFTRSGNLAPDRAGIVFSRAQALRRLGGRRDEAIALYEQYLATGHGTRDEEARRHLKELRTQGAEPR